MVFAAVRSALGSKAVVPSSRATRSTDFPYHFACRRHRLSTPAISELPVKSFTCFRIPDCMLALWVDFPYHFACRRRLRSTVPAFPGLLVPCVRRTSHPIPSENCTAAGSELEHVFARAASAGRPAIAGRFELVTPPLLLPLRLFVPPLQDLLSSTVGGYRGRRCCRGCPVAASRCAEKPVRSASFLLRREGITVPRCPVPIGTPRRPS